MPETVVIVLVFVASNDSEEALSEQCRHGVRQPSLVSRVAVRDGFDDSLRQADLLVKLPQSEQSRIGTELGVGRFDHNGPAGVKVE